MSTAVRQPAVAGQFYPGKREQLEKDIHTYLSAAKGPKLKAKGCVVPHAGYMYSGAVAGAVYGRLELPKRYIILCPNHTGQGQPLAIMSEGSWLTPLGEAAIDSELAESLKRDLPLIKEDDAAHRSEHALEVQLPFLQTQVQEFTFVPITVGIGQFEVLSALGVVISRVIQQSNTDVLVIASSDMNHYENDQETRVKDAMAIEQMLMLNARGLYETVHRESISMCGYGPAVAMITAAQRLGATKAELIKYATSGDVSGDTDWVVGYAGVVVSE